MLLRPLDYFQTRNKSSFLMLSTPNSLVATLSIALGLITTPVIAAGGFPPINSPPGACGILPADASCEALFTACVESRPPPTDPFSSDICVAAASCYPISVDSFLGNVFCRLSGPSSSNPRSATSPRLSDAVYNRIAGTNGQVTLPSYRAWFTAQVHAANPNTDKLVDLALIRESFDIMAAWTDTCDNASIPKGNFLDWFQWSSTVRGPQTTCGLMVNCPSTFVPYCIDLAVSCSHNDNAVSNPFSIPECVAGALCWEEGVNSFLQAVTCRNNFEYNRGVQAPVSTAVPALTSSILPSSISFGAFSDFIVEQMSRFGTRAPGPATPLSGRWSLIVAWTNFCSTNIVPRANLSDLLRYSFTKLTSTTCTGGSQCTPDPNASCEQLFQACVATANVLTNPYTNINCVLAATCKDGGINAFGEAVGCAKNTQSNPRAYPRLSSSVFNALAFGDGFVNQQNYIDSYYGALSTLTNPAWPDVAYVIGKWTTIQTWTAFPSGEVPYGNFADFLQYA
ncbi:hypothetical protein EYR40_005099 [Pleurotus pulmonarius]|nr:hypothetical protein EYR36_006528 [Pleurotus pulmonarius]KAF4601899.1 hypothetical protein EYR40_005099 [Pleurotus pulmonarius]